MVAQQLRNGVSSEHIEDFLAFLAGPSGSRVLTYDQDCQEGVKQLVCGYWGVGVGSLSAEARQHLIQICTNQGWNPV